MDDRLQTMIRQLLGRDATAEDRKRILTLVSNLPREVLASPAALADIVLRADQLRQFESAIERATWDAQQRVDADLPNRVEKAALAALNKMRDLLPIDAADRVSRMLKAAAAWTILVILIAASAGWMLHGHTVRREQARYHAAAESSFNRCIDAAEGSAMNVQSRAEALRYDSAVYRTQARSCAAEYADRRAGGS